MIDLLIRVLRKSRLLRYVVMYPRRRVGGLRMKIPVIMGAGLLNLEDREPWMDDVLRPLLATCKGLFVDVGVNVGQTLLKVRAIEPGRNYLGFEPHGLCVAYVEELTRVNGIADIRVVPAALSDSDRIDQLAFYSLDPSDATASIASDLRPGTRILFHKVVPAYRFDQLPAPIITDRLGVVKIDVNGGELEVLLGMRDHLRRDGPPVVFEILPVHRESNIQRLRRQEGIEALLKELDYLLYRIHIIGGPIRLEAITAPIGIHGDLDWSNYLAVPRAREAELLAGFAR